MTPGHRPIESPTQRYSKVSTTAFLWPRQADIYKCALLVIEESGSVLSFNTPINANPRIMLSDPVNARGSGLWEDRAGAAKAVFVLSKLLSPEEEGRA